MASKRNLIIQNPTYFEAIASARRMEIISALGDAGPASITDLADRLGLSAHSLYYHMGLLLKAGIVKSAREGKRKKESVYRLASSGIFLEPDPKSNESMKAAKRSLDSILRITSREVIEALQSGAKRKGNDREVYGIRLKARIQPKTLQLINKHLKQVEKIIRDSSGGDKSGKLYAITLVLTPSGKSTS